MKILPILLSDSYKQFHVFMYTKGMYKLYSNMTPRSYKYLGCEESVFFGLQYYIKKYLIEEWNENFFNRPLEEVLAEYKRFHKFFSMVDISVTHIEKLHKLGYLPLRIKGLKEGTRVPVKVPYYTIVNTDNDSAWLVNFLETQMSTVIWDMCVVATIGDMYRKVLNKYALETTGTTEGVQWQGHDFCMRGRSSIESTFNQAGWLLSFTGTDTIPAVLMLEEYYDANIENELVGSSVPASEHSVMTSYGKEDELGAFKRLLDQFPTGILSVVSDSFDLWQVLTKFLPELKEQILARDGKLVIRPDCLDDKSQILTPKGWKYFKDLTKTDLVAQVKENGTYEFVKPLKIINEPYEGDMYEIRDFHGKIDLVVTPNHRLVSYKNSDNSLSIKEASDYKQNYWKYKKLRSPKSQSKGRELTNYERFLIALQADGCIKYVNKDLSTRVEFNFQKERKHDRLLEILKNTDLEYNVYFAKSRKGQSTFSVLIPYNKMVSKTFDWVDTSNLDSLWTEQFIEELKYWDSSIRNDGRFKYDTTVKQNINVVELIAIAAGKGVYISDSEDNRKKHFSNVYTAHIMDNPYVGGQAISKNKIHYKGTVHCVKVPTGMILVKRNQGVCVTGNSGNPVDIICGKNSDTKYGYYSSSTEHLTRMSNGISKPEWKGVIELLWDVFGGTINEQGYKVLDPHIGAIYGDSITLERAEQICQRLKAKGFASTNIVLGVGSYTMNYNTRDSLGIAVKSTYCEVYEECEGDCQAHQDEKDVDICNDGCIKSRISRREIFKDPITDDGLKKSAKGLLSVIKSDKSLILKDQCSWEEEAKGELQTVFLNGKLIKSQSLKEIRKNLNK